MSAARLARTVPFIAFVVAIALIATGRVEPGPPVFGVLLGVVVVTGLVQARLNASARRERESRMSEVAASYGLEPVEPPRRRGLIRTVRSAAQGDETVQRIDPDRDSPTWPLWHAVLPSGSTDCRFLAVGQRNSRPTRLSVERTTSSSGSGRNRTSTTYRSAVVATRVDVDGDLEVRPAGRLSQTIGDVVGRALRQESHEVGVRAFDNAYAVTGDADAVQAVLDPATASWWPDRVGDATVAISDGWLAAAQRVSLDAGETAAAAEHLLSVIDALSSPLVD